MVTFSLHVHVYPDGVGRGRAGGGGWQATHITNTTTVYCTTDLTCMHTPNKTLLPFLETSCPTGGGRQLGFLGSVFLGSAPSEGSKAYYG